MSRAIRKILSSLFVAFCALSVLLALVPLAMILFFVVSQGIQAVNLAFFTQMPKPVGEQGGGMANSIVGTLILTGLGSLVAVPIGIMSGIYMSEYAGTKMAAMIRFAADTLNGVPSIVIGVFAYGIAVLPFKQFSAIAGGIALGMMMIPIIARTTEELLLLVPGTMREGALALGATQARAMFSVVLPAALPGIITGVVLGAGTYRRGDGAAALYLVQQSVLLDEPHPTDFVADGADLQLRFVAVRRLAPSGLGGCARPREYCDALLDPRPAHDQASPSDEQGIDLRLN